MTGQATFRVGVVERWVVATGAAALIGGCYWFASNTNERLDRLSEQQAELAKQQAVTNQQLSTLTLQLANVPALSERVSRNEARIEALERRESAR